MSERSVTSAVADALTAKYGARRMLVEIQFDSGTVRLWNGLGTLSAMGQSWTGSGRLGTVDAIEETLGVVASGATVQLAIVPTDEVPDAPDAILNIALGETFQSRPLTIYQAQLDPDTLALIDDPFVRFAGYVDVMADEEEPGRAVISLTAENRLIDLERAKKRTYTPEDQKAVHAGDTFFDEVHTLKNREIVLK